MTLVLVPEVLAVKIKGAVGVGEIGVVLVLVVVAVVLVERIKENLVVMRL